MDYHADGKSKVSELEARGNGLARPTLDLVFQSYQGWNKVGIYHSRCMILRVPSTRASFCPAAEY